MMIPSMQSQLREILEDIAGKMEYLYDKDISTKKIIIKISIPDDFKPIYLHDFLDETVPIFGYALKGIYEQYQDEYFFHQPIIEMKMGSFDLSMIVRMCEISKFNEQDGKCATSVVP